MQEVATSYEVDSMSNGQKITSLLPYRNAKYFSLLASHTITQMQTAISFKEMKNKYNNNTLLTLFYAS